MAIACHPDYKRIATEEAWAPTHIVERYQKLVGSIGDPGFDSLWGFYGASPSLRAQQVFARLQDLGERRLHDMDECGIDVAVLSLT